MTFRYRPFFTIACLHAYFAADPPRCRSLSVRPTAACARTRGRLGLLFRPTSGGGIVLYDEESGILPRGLQENALLSFTLHSTDPNFINYTDLALGGGAASCYYFTNLRNSATIGSEDDKAVLLHAAPHVTASADRVPVRARGLMLPGAGQAPPFAVHDAWGRRAATAEAAPPDMSSLPPGRYRLSDAATAEPYEFCLIDGLPETLFGLVEIGVAPPLADAEIAPPYRLFDGSGRATAPTFTVVFEARPTRWR